MKKIYFVLTLLFITNAVSAQYSEVWNSPESSSYIIGCENMDNDANKEIVTLEYDDLERGANGLVIYIVDGVTGKLEWKIDGLTIESGIFWYGNAIYTSVNYNDPQKYPRLIDVNNDGKFELLFYGKVSGETSHKLHLFAFGGAITKSAEISANSNLQIENFPNPFSTVTTIKYNVPIKSMVTVKVYDMNGNEIKTLANAQQSQGDYEIPFNRTDLQNGTYFYQVRVGSNVGAKKMVVIE